MESSNNAPETEQTKCVEYSSTQIDTSNAAVTDNGYLSATGVNPSLPGFSPANLAKHWGSGTSSDHSGQYPEFTKEQYAQRALTLVRSATDDNVLGYKAADGAIIRYDKNANDFVKGFITGIATLYKPNDGENYFNRLMEREGGKQCD